MLEFQTIAVVTNVSQQSHFFVKFWLISLPPHAIFKKFDGWLNLHNFQSE